MNVLNAAAREAPFQSFLRKPPLSGKRQFAYVDDGLDAVRMQLRKEAFDVDAFIANRI